MKTIKIFHLIIVIFACCSCRKPDAGSAKVTGQFEKIVTADLNDSKTEYSFSYTGDQVSSIDAKRDGRALNRFSFKYEGGNVSEINFYIRSKETDPYRNFQTFRLEYLNGKLVKIEQYLLYGQRMIFENYATYAYSPNGQLSQKDNYIRSGDSTLPEGWIVFTYDANGNIEKIEKIFFGNNLQYSFRLTYNDIENTLPVYNDGLIAYLASHVLNDMSPDDMIIGPGIQEAFLFSKNYVVKAVYSKGNNEALSLNFTYAFNEKKVLTAIKNFPDILQNLVNGSVLPIVKDVAITYRHN